MRRWPPKFTVLKNAQTGIKKNKSSGRDAMHYRCAKCKKDFPRTKVQVDHIKSVAKQAEDASSSYSKEEHYWTAYIDAMFCDEKGMQILCKPCHKKKTNKERKD